MARVTHVKKAQARYHTKPVLDDDGKPVKIALTRKDGSPKMTRAKGNRPARPVFITKTVADKTRPKPNYTCGKCGVEIKPGDPYKWIKPKSGPYGGRLMVRCAKCPTWQVWDYSSSLSANIARIEHDASEAIMSAGTVEDAEAARDDAAQAIRDLAEQKREAASNIEGGFGHATSQSEELEQMADDLESWADDVEGVDLDDLSEFPCDNCTDGQTECSACAGTGKEDESDDENAEDCADCDGNGEVECDFCDGEGHDLEAARESWDQALADELGNCPV